MRRRWMLIVNGLFMASGCIYHVQERVDQATCELANHAVCTWRQKNLRLSQSPRRRPLRAPPASQPRCSNQAYDVQTTAYMQQEPDTPDLQFAESR